MLILFDHGVPAPLVPYLIGHAVVKARGRGWDRLPTAICLPKRSGLGSTFFLPLTKIFDTSSRILRAANSCRGAEHAAMAAGPIAYGRNCGGGKRGEAWELCRSSDPGGSGVKSGTLNNPQSACGGVAPELADVGADLGGIGICELGLQFFKDLAERALAVAAFEHLTSCALQFDCAFGNRTTRSSVPGLPSAPHRHPAARRG